MTQGAKRHKGQIQIIEGSPTGEALNINRFEYENCVIKLLGEAKVGTAEDQYRWYIQKFQYNSCKDVTHIFTAMNQLYTEATAVSVDTSAVGGTKITITGGSLEEAKEGDKITLTTTNNTIGSALVLEVLGSQEVLIKDEALSLSDEISTPIAQEDLVITIEERFRKEFNHRRWDLRALYVYQ